MVYAGFPWFLLSTSTIFFMNQRPLSRLLLGVSLIAALCLQSCGFASGLTNQFSLYGIQTHVELSEDNFRLVDRVSGSASLTYVFGFGGISKQGLIEQAKADMMSNIEPDGRALAVANVTVETKGSLMLIVRKYTVTVTADVIEFTD